MFQRSRGGYLLTMIILLLSTQSVYPQKEEAVYGEQLKSGSTIYAVTNRLADTSERSHKFLNEVRSEKSLIYLKTNFYQPDSLHLQLLDSNLFYRAVLKQDGDWLVFVHGDSKTFSQSVMRGYDIQHLHGVNVIVFSWPSKDPEVNGVKNFKNSQKNTILSYDHFLVFLRSLKAFKMSLTKHDMDSKLSIFIHSLGNSYIEQIARDSIAMSELGLIFDNLVTNAAAVNEHDHKYWVEKLNIQERVFITCNKQDFNLKGLRIFTKEGKQLGEKIGHPIAENADYVHFSSAVGFRFPTGTTHTYFIGEVPDKSRNIRIFYRELMHGNKIDLDLEDMFHKRSDDLGFDIVK